MKSAAAPFNPNDPFDVACEAVRGELLVAAHRVLGEPALARLDDRLRLVAMLAGGVVAVSCVGLSFVGEQDKAVIKSILVDCLDDWFEVAATMERRDEVTKQ